MIRRHLAFFCVLLLALSMLFQSGLNLTNQKVSAAPANFSRGLVSVPFDDNLASQYSSGRDALNANGIKATFYTVTSDVDNEPDYMFFTQIQQLKADGHEIASHTVTHPPTETDPRDMTQLTPTELDNELPNSKRFLEGHGLGPIYDFACPNGEYNAATSAEVAKYYISQREGYPKYGNDINNSGNFDPYAIHVKRVLPNTNASEVTSWLAQANTDNAWLVLMYHSVEVLPYNEDPNNDYWYSISPSDFAAHAAAIASSGVPAVTVKQAMDEVYPPIATASAPDGHGSTSR